MAIPVEAERFCRAVMANPVEAILWAAERISQLHEYQPRYEPESNWEAHLHRWLARTVALSRRYEVGLVLARHHVGSKSKRVAIWSPDLW